MINLFFYDKTQILIKFIAFRNSIMDIVVRVFLYLISQDLSHNSGFFLSLEPKFLRNQIP